MFKIFTLKRDYEVLMKDRDAKADQVLSLEAKVKKLDRICNEYAVRATDAERDALEAKQALRTQEYYNAQLQQQMERKNCDGCIHSENYRKCTSCARYPKLKDKFEPCPGGISGLFCGTKGAEEAKP